MSRELQSQWMVQVYSDTTLVGFPSAATAEHRTESVPSGCVEGGIMGVDYGNEKFFSVLSYAVGSTDSVQERLSNVISEVRHLQTRQLPR